MTVKLSLGNLQIAMLDTMGCPARPKKDEGQ